MVTIQLTDPHADDVLDMLQQICPEAGLQRNADDTVRITTQICRELLQDPDIMPTRHPCKCICHIIGFSRTVTIQVHHDLSAFGGGVTFPDDADDGVPGNSPSGFGPGTDAEVRIENRNRWVARRADNPAVTTPEPDWLILAHELCGHTLRFFRGDHPEYRPGHPGFRPDWHDDALGTSRDIRGAKGLPPILEPPFVP